MSKMFFVRLLLLTLALLMGMAILIMSVVPVNRVALGTRAAVGVPLDLVERASMLHYLVHIVTYCTLSALTWFALTISKAGTTNNLVALCIIMLLGCGTEYLQHRLYDNPLEVNDVYTNVIATGAMFGLLGLASRAVKVWSKEEPAGQHVAYVLRDLD